MSETEGKNLSRELSSREAKIKSGGAPKYHQANAAKGKLFARERLRLLLDPDAPFCEDGFWA
ncbi:MAG: acyl-CoA carboxylase subunit beta, partial [Desulfotomaculales bacterium]